MSLIHLLLSSSSSICCVAFVFPLLLYAGVGQQFVQKNSVRLYFIKRNKEPPKQYK
jgi:hypothetical protein